MTTVLDKFDINKHYFEDPYPHVIIEDALPEDYYNKLYNTWPVSEIKKALPIIGGHTFRYMSNDVLNKKLVPVSTEWQNFFKDHTSQDYYLKVLNIFEKHIKHIDYLKNEKVEIRGAGKSNVVTETQFVIHNPVKETTRTDHLDNPIEIYAGLLYMRKPEDNAEGGDFVIYKSDPVTEVSRNNGREILKKTQREVVKTIKYKPNCFVMFLNTNTAVHGVTPRINSETERLSINIIAEVTDRKYAMFPIRKI